MFYVIVSEYIIQCEWVWRASDIDFTEKHTYVEKCDIIQCWNKNIFCKFETSYKRYSQWNAENGFPQK